VRSEILLSVIIPVYNEASTIGEVVDRVAALPLRKEIIVVDDGSTDESVNVLGTKSAQVRIVHQSRINLGKGTAIRIGLTYASGDAVIIQDADLELNPEEYSRLIEVFNSGADAVYGSRFRDGPNRTIPRRTVMANRLLTKLTNGLYHAQLTDMETSYKLVRTSVIKSLRIEAQRFDFEPELTAKLLLAGHQIQEVPISYSPRTKLEGKKVGWRDGVVAISTLLRCRWRYALHGDRWLKTQPA